MTVYDLELISYEEVIKLPPEQTIEVTVKNHIYQVKVKHIDEFARFVSKNNFYPRYRIPTQGE